MLFGKLGSLFTPQHLIENQQPSPAFVHRLQVIFGRDLHVEWNPRKQRWVIEQCIRHFSQPDRQGVTVHSHQCERIYVWLVQGDEDDYMPLGDRVIDKLHEIETYRQFGTGDAALKRFVQASRDFDIEQAKKARERAQDYAKYSRRFNRTTWNKFWTLFRRHNMIENK